MYKEALKEFKQKIKFVKYLKGMISIWEELHLLIIVIRRLNLGKEFV